MRSCGRIVVHSITLEEPHRRRRRVVHANYLHSLCGKRTKLLAKNIRMTVKDPAEGHPHSGARLTRHRFQVYQIGAGGRGRGCRNATLPVLPDAADLPDKLEEPAAPQPQPLLPRPHAPQLEMGVGLCREQVTGWLMGHGFESVSGTFAEYSGTDMMRLTREDLVTMCGLPSGTRLFYALRSKPAIRVVVYVSVSGKNYYNALYLKSATAAELASQLRQLLQLPQLPEKHMFLLGPNNIHIVVSDDVVANITSETAFLLQLLKDEESERCCVLLRTTSSPPGGQ